MDYLPINFDLIKHPSNWLIVILMVVIAGIALDVVLQFANSYNRNIEG